MAHHHDHDHGHGHHHHGPANYNKAFAIAVFANLGFTILEAVYALAANSMSLLADAGHNLGDVLGLVFAWLASWLVTVKPSGRYSYGLKKTTILAALCNALFLVLASALIVGESIDKLFNPEPIHDGIVMVVAAIGIVINGVTALLFMRGRHDDLNIKGAFLHLAYDALISVGVVITGAVILWTGWVTLDPIVGLLIVVAILAGTWGLLKDSVNLILDAVPRHVDQEAVKKYLLAIPGVKRIHDLHIWGLSTTGAALTAHLIMPDDQLNDADYQKINEELHHNFKIDHVTIQVEKGHQDNPCGQADSCG